MDGQMHVDDSHVGVRDQNGEVRAIVVENTRASTLERFVRESCITGATIATDTHGGYIGLAAAGRSGPRKLSSGYKWIFRANAA